MKVFIITEGGSTIGVGHITRCFSLWQAFEDKGIVSELVINGDETVNAFLRGTNHLILDWIKDRGRLCNMIKDADIAIIDSYLADAEFFRKVSESVKTCVYVDDNNRIDYPAGIVVNGGIGANDFDYPKQEGKIYLLGPGYIPLRKVFRATPEKVVNNTIENIMITFGGDDARNMTPKILKLLHKDYKELTKNVVIGNGFRNIEEIKREVDRRTTLIYYPDAEKIKKVMLESDLAISAGGQTLYELARTGVPTIAVSVANNQMNNIDGWQKAGFIEYAGWWGDKQVLSNISQKINLLKDVSIRQEKAQIGMSAVDGKGAARIIKKIMRVTIKNNLTIRKAEMKDMYVIYELSNEPEIRRNSFSEETIELDDHKEWFARKLIGNDCVFLVAESGDIFIGQVRFDITGEEAVISISIVRDFRGFGFGQDIMKKALDYVKVTAPSVKIIRAYIKAENVSSIKYFKNAHFQFGRKLIINNKKTLEYFLQFEGDTHEL